MLSPSFRRKPLSRNRSQFRILDQVRNDSLDPFYELIIFNLDKMEKPLRKLLALIIILVCLGGMTGCPAIMKPPVDDAEARQIIGLLMQSNRGLTQFKGLAKIRMENEDRVQTGRVAFAAAHPDKMRVELLNMMGTPVTGMAGDGEHISIMLYGENKRYKLRQSRTALESIIHVPISLADLQSLLSGRVPLPEHESAQIVEVQAQYRVVGLKNRWHVTVAKLKVNRETRQIQSMKVYDGEGEVKYRVQWLQWEEAGEYTIPSQLGITSSANQKLVYKLGRFWPNAQLPPSTFILEPHE